MNQSQVSVEFIIWILFASTLISLVVEIQAKLVEGILVEKFFFVQMNFAILQKLLLKHLIQKKLFLKKFALQQFLELGNQL